MQISYLRIFSCNSWIVCFRRSERLPLERFSLIILAYDLPVPDRLCETLTPSRLDEKNLVILLVCWIREAENTTRAPGQVHQNCSHINHMSSPAAGWPHRYMKTLQLWPASQPALLLCLQGNQQASAGAPLNHMVNHKKKGRQNILKLHFGGLGKKKGGREGREKGKIR